MSTKSKQQAFDLFEQHRAEYIAKARAAALRIALSRKSGRITIDDVRAECPPPKSIDPRVMGGVLRAPEWERVGYQSSKRTVCHKRPVAIFRLAA